MLNCSSTFVNNQPRLKKRNFLESNFIHQRQPPFFPLNTAVTWRQPMTHPLFSSTQLGCWMTPSSEVAVHADHVGLNTNLFWSFCICLENARRIRALPENHAFDYRILISADWRYTPAAVSRDVTASGNTPCRTFIASWLSRSTAVTWLAVHACRGTPWRHIFGKHTA